ncbi:MAG: hypothetical protein AB7P12_03505 [Alphaproteobacteria bacterium]
MTVRPAESAVDREAIYRLRYQCYLREGAIEPSFPPRMSDRFDDLGNAWIFGVHRNGVLLGSIRLNVTTRESRDLPALTVFSRELRHKINAGKVIVDPTRFVIDREAGGGDRLLPYVFVRIAWMAAEHFAADYLLATVRTEHQAFYKRTLGHQVLCEARPYPSLSKPISLMSLEVPAARQAVLARHPYFASTEQERAVMFGRGGKAAREAA